jgi:hypothetical protein
MGGFDGTGFLESQPAWVPILNRNSDFLVTLKHLSMNNHIIKGTDKNYSVMIDSGTTFSYFPKQLFDLLESHFKWFLRIDPDNNIKGSEDFSYGRLCWRLDDYTSSHQFIQSMPIIRFAFDTDQGGLYEYDWYPSEYLY